MVKNLCSFVGTNAISLDFHVLVSDNYIHGYERTPKGHSICQNILTKFKLQKFDTPKCGLLFSILKYFFCLTIWEEAS